MLCNKDVTVEGYIIRKLESFCWNFVEHRVMNDDSLSVKRRVKVGM